MRITNKLLFSTLSISFLFVFSATMAIAEENDSAKVSDGSKTTFMSVGGGLRNVNRANSVLTEQGIPGLSKYHADLGLGHTTRLHRLVSSAELSFSTSNSWESNNRKSALDAATLTWLLGFDVVKTSMFHLYPYAGTGVGILNLTTRDTDQPFSSYAVNRMPSINLWQGNMVFNAGAGADFIIPSPFKRDFTIGLRGGYQFDPKTRQTWHGDGTEISDGPRPNMSGVYVKLIVGKTGPLSGMHKQGSCGEEASKGCGHTM